MSAAARFHAPAARRPAAGARRHVCKRYVGDPVGAAAPAVAATHTYGEFLDEYCPQTQFTHPYGNTALLAGARIV